jgi:hypothetical protein
MAGLLGGIDRPGAPDLRRLSIDPSMTVQDIETFMKDDQRAFRLAMSGLLLGGFAAFAGLISYAYMVVHGHAFVAGTGLALWVLALIGDFIWECLDRS